MASPSNKTHSLRPYLLTSGFALIISGALMIYIFSCAFASCPNTGDSISILRMIFRYIGIASIIVPIYIIGDAFPNKKNETNLTLILLIFFIIGDLVINFVPGITSFAAGWGGFIIFIIYGVVRLAAFIKIHSSLNIPNNKYGNPIWWIFGGSFLLLTILTFVFALISGFIQDPDVIDMLIEVSVWVSLGQFCLDGLSLVGIGTKLTIDGSKKPTIDRTTSERVTTFSSPELKQDDFFFPLQKPIQSTTYESSKEEEEEVLTYCSFCGAQTYKDNEFCENCGRKL